MHTCIDQQIHSEMNRFHIWTCPLSAPIHVTYKILFPHQCHGNYCACFCTLNAVLVHPQDISKWSTLAAYLTVTILNVFLFPTNFLLSSKGSLKSQGPTRAKIWYWSSPVSWNRLGIPLQGLVLSGLGQSYSFPSSSHDSSGEYLLSECAPVVPALGRLRQGTLKLEAATKWDCISKIKKIKNDREYYIQRIKVRNASITSM